MWRCSFSLTAYTISWFFRLILNINAPRLLFSQSWEERSRNRRLRAIDRDYIQTIFPAISKFWLRSDRLWLVDSNIGALFISTRYWTSSIINTIGKNTTDGNITKETSSCSERRNKNRVDNMKTSLIMIFRRYSYKWDADFRLFEWTSKESKVNRSNNIQYFVFFSIVYRFVTVHHKYVAECATLWWRENRYLSINRYIIDNRNNKLVHL